MPTPIGLDFETYYNTKEGIGIKELGMVAYTRHPRFNAYMLSVSDGTDSWAGPPSRFNWDALEGRTLLSHNAAFDQKVYKSMVARGLAPQLNIPEWHCTANLSTFLCSRRDLARASEFLLGESVDKSTRGDADGKTWEDLIAKDGGKEMLEYARRDASLCWRIWAKFSHLWPQCERDLSALTIKQCERGCQIDQKKLELFYSVATKALVQAELALPWIDEGRKPTSPKAVAEWCAKVGIPEPPVKKHDGEEAYDEWASTFAPHHPWVKAYTDYRVIKKFIASLETIRIRLIDDGIFTYDLLYFGAHTGRWAGSGGFNMQNMRKEPLYIDDKGWLVTDSARLKEIDNELDPKKGSGKLPGWVAYALDIRALFIARPGKKLVISDLSQIEPRVLAWLVGDSAMLELMTKGQSPYEAHARRTMNWTGGELKHADKYLYALAKARVLGLGYGCGWKKFIKVAYDMAGLDITKDDPAEVQAVNDAGVPCFNADGTPRMVDGFGTTSRRIVTEYREQNPLIASQDPENPGLWRSLDDAFRASVGGDFTITLPSGRKLHYPDVQIERKAVPDPDHPGRHIFKRCYTAAVFSPKHNAVVRTPLYGGLLTENLVQATARDVFGEQLVAMENDDISVLWNVHDEAVTEVDADRPASDVNAHMSKSPKWMPGLPVSAETVEVPHYKK